MTSFVDSFEYQELLNISKEHLDALDRTRIREDAVIGVDNYNRLMVSTVFAAISIEAALNNYILIHCLFLDRPYLQGLFADITENYLRASIHTKLNLVRDHWPDGFSADILQDVRELFRIRNRITHQSGDLLTANDAQDGNAKMRNRPLTRNDMQHMLRHYDIAYDFLSRFWLPGSRELEYVRDSAIPDGGS
ncbi:MAG TPA: hypothetical protein VMY42_02510 [Thermoguttaceae bacterium]|nr:hypothetical protein [Thermoguttaceae bacterium]